MLNIVLCVFREQLLLQVVLQLFDEKPFHNNVLFSFAQPLTWSCLENVHTLFMRIFMAGTRRYNNPLYHLYPPKLLF